MKKTVIVTGSTRGIGLGIAKKLAEEGYNVVMTSRGSKEKYTAAIKEVSALGAEVLYVQADISDHDDREKIVSETVKRFGRIDALVNNAGVAPKERRDLLEMTEESFDYVVGTNTRGNMFLTQAVAKQMIRQDFLSEEYRKANNKGAIVNVSSCSAEVSSISRGEYCISKAGVSMLTTLYADRLAPEGITVNEVRPGVIETDMTSVVHEKYDRLIEDGLFPIARWGYPLDVANAVALFLSDGVRYTTGNHIDVDGGFHIKRL
jgi:NAD(P)-dependent dehydrogenase (short-subunit alcohol dehydrogenase family)